MSSLGHLFARLGVAINAWFPDETPMLHRHTQRHTASIRRRDGHTITGLPGDCLRAAAATALGLEDDLALRHYALYRSWFEVMRVDARNHGFDWVHIYRADHTGLPIGPFTYSLSSGPSPRGPFWHVVVVDHEARLVHDPHPSRAGLDQYRDLFVLTRPYFPPPTFPELEPAR